MAPFVVDSIERDFATLPARLASAETDAQRWLVVNVAARAHGYESVLIVLNSLVARGLVSRSFWADYVCNSF
jgi:hypothetical protein